MINVSVVFQLQKIQAKSRIKNPSLFDKPPGSFHQPKTPGTSLESSHSTTSKSGCAPITAAAASLSLGLKVLLDSYDVGSCEEQFDRIIIYRIKKL